MLRTLFVLSLTFAGIYYSFQGPFYILLFYVWNAYFRPESWVWDFARDLILGLKISYLSGVAVVVTTAFSRQRFLWNGHIVLLIVMILHALASTLLGEKVDYSWQYFVEFFKAITITLLIPTLANDTKKIRLLTLVMCLSLGFEGAKQGWVGLLTHPGSSNLNDVPFLGDNNGVAVGMLMLAPLIAALGATTSSKWRRRFFHFLLVGVIYRSITTYSRGGFLACGTLALTYWVHSRGKLRLLVGFAVVAAIILPVLPDEFWGRIRTIKTYEEVEDVSALSRLHFWNVAVQMGNQHPIFGVGFNGFGVSYNKYDSTRGLYGEGRSVHSVWFGVLSELGYVGLMIYILNLVFSLRNCGAARRIARRNPEYEDLLRFATSVESALWVFIVGGTFLPFQYNEMVFHMVGLSIALRRVTKSLETSSQFDSTQTRYQDAEAKFDFQGAGV